MIALWIPVTIAAAFLQNLRSALQKAIKGRLSTAGAAYSRFLYALPLAALYLWGLVSFGGEKLPPANGLFLLYCALGGLSQILFTVVLLWLFSFRSFAVGTTFSKLEVVLVAALGAILLGDTVGPWALLAIAIGALGTMILSFTETRMTPMGLLRGLGDRATAVGILCAALLGASSVFYRGAILALESPHFVLAASFALAVALAMQTAMMGAWFLLFDRAELGRVLKEWRRAAPVGLSGMLCSVCWFTAFAVQNAAYVRALGQIELVFTFFASVVVFKEKVKATELLGTGMIVAAILLIVLAA
ncbi:MAG: EamA family transporter [Minwuia sp.]|uniref:EamA family transporter n=1 Tax=Minwuia sp. TaxID=2493630 RepID=UPI003A8C5201